MPDHSQDKFISIDIMDRQGTWHHLTVPTGVGLNVMEACIANDLPIISVCGGMALCGGCHTYMVSDHQLPARSEQEEETLDKLQNVKSNSRLCCQIKITEKIDGLKLHFASL